MSLQGDLNYDPFGTALQQSMTDLKGVAPPGPNVTPGPAPGGGGTGGPAFDMNTPTGTAGVANFAPPPYTGPQSASLPTVPQFSYPNFKAPTGVNYQNDPGYQFRLSQGENALQNSAAAQGVLHSGNTLEGILNYGQNYASQEYGNVYNRALQNYNANLGTAEQRFAPQMAQYGLQGQAAMAAYQNAIQLYEFQQQAALQAQQQAQTPPTLP